MFVLGIFIHVMFLFSIFDIYFKSPIVDNVTPYRPQHQPLADRLVLCMVDGLRAESFVNHTTMEYLRSVANSFGRWGISNTQVPTESRPGHVAVIAGFYEDPSAVAKGWKENPVDFDSVFNQTSFTWCWGAYDIVNIFSKGNVEDHIFTNKFDPYDQTFSTDKNTTLLDEWVFDRVKDFFHGSLKKDDQNKLHQEKIMFFLHLLGTDTSGHTHKPNTENFETTLRFVDEGIKEIERVIRDYYNDDGRTTFLMTSDHGMTDWGSHGAGENHETQTPYVIWGAGVQQVEGDEPDLQTNSMSLSHRLDIKQADLTPLMATILSIPVPVNSIGKLPAELLNLTLPNKAKAIHSNSKQLASQYDKKRQDVEANAIQFLYQPFEPFTKQKYEEVNEFIEILLQEEDYERLILVSEEIIDLSLAGLKYYHNYYQRPLLILVTLSFLGWIMFLLRVLTEQKINSQLETSNKKKTKMLSSTLLKQSVNIVFIMLLLVAIFVVYAQDLPVQYFFYCLMPIALWHHVFSSLYVWTEAYRHIKKNKTVFVLWVEVLSYILGSLTLALSFTYRWMLSIPLVGMGLWPFLSRTRNHLTKSILFAWPLGCVLLSFFSFMPVVGKDVFIELVIASGLIWSVFILVYIFKVLQPLCSVNKESKQGIVLSVAQVILMMFSLHNIYVQSKRFERGTSVSPIHQAVAWTISVISNLLPLAISKRLICRLTAIYTSLLNFYLLLSVSHESLFMVTLIFNVTCWIYIEFRLLHLQKMNIMEYTFGEEAYSEKNKGFTSIERGISDQDFRRAFFFVLYIILAFFGTGNIASLNSFEVRWVTCFITSFQPFIMTTLILLKTLSPFLIVACSFRAVQHLSKAPTGYLNIIVLIYSNIMGIQLLYNVKNTGSWLEIGTSISQFVIVQVITLFIVIINQIAKFLTDISIHQFAGTMFKSRKKYV